MTKRFLAYICFSVLTLGCSAGFADTGTTQQVDKSASTEASSKLTWLTNYSQAVQEAQKEHKHILLFFTGSDWCGWCKKLHQEVFASPEFAKAEGSRFVFVDVDFPMNKKLPADEAQQNAMLKQKFGISGYPTVIILDSNENFVAEAGYRPGGWKAYADFLNQLIQQK
ncbi:MAG: Disulfide bond reductase DsbH [Chlamydiales bacterium]|nr:Disulfide bond reductase DsbH [Chlamydiales bacterium]